MRGSPMSARGTTMETGKHLSAGGTGGCRGSSSRPFTGGGVTARIHGGPSRWRPGRIADGRARHVLFCRDFRMRERQKKEYAWAWLSAEVLGR